MELISVYNTHISNMPCAPFCYTVEVIKELFVDFIYNLAVEQDIHIDYQMFTSALGNIVFHATYQGDRSCRGKITKEPYDFHASYHLENGDFSLFELLNQFNPYTYVPRSDR